MDEIMNKRYFRLISLQEKSEIIPWSEECIEGDQWKEQKKDPFCGMNRVQQQRRERERERRRKEGG